MFSISKNPIHEYFTRDFTEWNIREFLEECDEEPFRVKIDIYVKSLQNIINSGEGKRLEKAQYLLDQYKKVRERINCKNFSSKGVQRDHKVAKGKKSFAKTDRELRKRKNVNYVEISDSTSESETECAEKKEYFSRSSSNKNDAESNSGSPKINTANYDRFVEFNDILNSGDSGSTESDGNESPCETVKKNQMNRRIIQNTPPSPSSLISIMRSIIKNKPLRNFSKIEKEFEPKFWAELIADRPVTAKAEFIKKLNPFVIIYMKQPKISESHNNWKNLRNLKAPKYNNYFSYEKEEWEKFLYWVERAVVPFLDAFESEYNPIQQTDCEEREWFGDYIIPIFQGALKLNIYCVKINQQEVVCGLGCGGPHKYDLTKWGSDEYQLQRHVR
ncbi:8466_t:CDS:2 [Diversispora eburnea]|uniref:8466_t:CDS:1 n=1 Tax=Diversispora eburnea TaxID=1213867 RepID=A0A9N9BHX0_9GLOM|nr:8466_t:CDS:2 [Diversispora eburnea]